MADVQDPKNALWRRNDQLNRWNISETNKESADRRDQRSVTFEDSYVFLAACSSGDKEEVKSLLAKEADINTANIDGLTALHQACIDDKLDMVRFLVEHKADINAADNEGWTALHATASCGFLEVARYLIEQGADIAAVNNDGELAIDLAEGSDMEDLLQDEMDKQGVDADSARDEEENTMLRDANQWLSSGYNEAPNAKTGAVALHCAAAKGYIKVMELLIQAGADPDLQDADGWTALHAAAHWGMEDACKTLVEALCDMTVKTNSGQTAMDIVDPDIEEVLQELKEKQALLRKDKEEKIKDLTNRTGNKEYRRRSSITRMSEDQKHNVVRSNAEQEKQILRSRVVVEEDRRSSESSEAEDIDMESSGSDESSDDSETEKKNEKNRQTSLNSTKQVNGAPTTTSTTSSVSTETTKTKSELTPKILEKKQTDTDAKKQIVPPPKAPTGGSTVGTSSSPRIQDLTTENNARLSERNTNTVTTTTAPTALTERIQTSDSGKKDDDKLKDERDRPITNKAPLQRGASLPTKISYTGSRQVPGFAPKPPVSRQDSTLTSRQDSTLSSATSAESLDPASWRACLRKTGSSSAVPETPTSIADRLPRSASSSWLHTHDRHTDNSKGRPISASSGDSLEVKNRVRQYMSRYDNLSTRSLPTTGLGRTSTGLTSRPVTTATTTRPATTTATTRAATTTAAAATNPSSLSSSYLYQPYVPMTRQRGENDRVTTVTTPTSPGTATTATGAATSSGRRGLWKVPFIARSFAPPVRDEEKEVERKAKARRARETRRSTQGVTREELKAAEQELKAANNDPKDRDPKDRDRLSSDSSTRDRLSSDDRSDKENKPDGAIATTTSASLLRRRTEERPLGDDVVPYNRRSYRDSQLSLDAGFNRASQRVGLTSTAASTTASITTATASTATVTATTTVPSSSSATVSSTTSSLTPYRQYRKNRDTEGGTTDSTTDALSRTGDRQDSEEKESPSQKSSAIRTRRKRESRRATGKVNPEDVQAAKSEETETKEKPKEESSRYGSSRYGDLSSTSSLYDSSSSRFARDRPSSYHSGYARSQSSTSLPDKEIDYKRLYEEQKEENEKLRKSVTKLTQELSDTKVDLEKLRLRAEPRGTGETAAERKEKRTLERKISELEEELRLMENLKQDNQRLKEENGALIRVISKLSK